MSKIINLSLAALFLVSAVSADLFDVGNLITIADGNNSNNNSWYKDVKDGYKIDDDEVEVNCIGNQNWDLEGFFLEGSQLTMVGGYDFLGEYKNTTSGDIFIDIDGQFNNDQTIPEYQLKGNHDVKSNFGYEYVIDINYDDLSYSVIDLRGVTNNYITSVYYDINVNSNPWKYVSGGQEIYHAAGTAKYQKDLTSQQTGFSGLKHNALSVDLSFLGDNTEFTSHFTMSCGNDNLMGHGTVSVPEPGSLSLLAVGSFFLVGLYTSRKRKK